jgi:putative transcriptional regulator
VEKYSKECRKKRRHLSHRLFTQLVQHYLSDEEYLRVQLELSHNPKAGAVVRGSGGVRKLRWRAPGRGKRGQIGRGVNIPPVREIRRKVGLSQSRFAALLGVSVRTLQDWEQGRRAPSGAARTLLFIAHKNPAALLDVA